MKAGHANRDSCAASMPHRTPWDVLVVLTEPCVVGPAACAAIGHAFAVSPSLLLTFRFSSRSPLLETRMMAQDSSNWPASSHRFHHAAPMFLCALYRLCRYPFSICSEKPVAAPRILTCAIPVETRAAQRSPQNNNPAFPLSSKINLISSWIPTSSTSFCSVLRSTPSM
jgi:hypothetical protein